MDELMTALEGAKVTTVDKPWGAEYQLVLGDALVKVITVKNHCRTSLQYHQRRIETVAVLEGKGGVQAGDGNWLTVVEDGPVRINPGQIHRSVGPALLLEIATNDPDDLVRVADDYGRV